MTHKERAGKSKAARPKHVPQRTCIACRQVAGKRSLVRLVRTEAGVVVDQTGKMAGRGAYIHPYQVCWRAVLRSNRLEQALRTRLSEEDRRTLSDFMATLPESEEADTASADSQTEVQSSVAAAPDSTTSG